MPLIQVSMIEGRSEEARVELIKELTDACERAIGAPRSSVRVLIQEIPPVHWGVGGVPKSVLDQQK